MGFHKVWQRQETTASSQTRLLPNGTHPERSLQPHIAGQPAAASGSLFSPWSSLGSAKEKKHHWGGRWWPSLFLTLSKPGLVEFVCLFYVWLRQQTASTGVLVTVVYDVTPRICPPVYVLVYFCSCFNFSVLFWRHGVTHYVTLQVASNFS